LSVDPNLVGIGTILKAGSGKYVVVEIVEFNGRVAFNVKNINSVSDYVIKNIFPTTFDAIVSNEATYDPDAPISMPKSWSEEQF